MTNHDIRPDGPLLQPSDIAAALGLFSRLPVPVDTEAAQARGARAAWAWPVAGAILGALAALAGAIGLALGLGPMLTAALVIAVQVITTGAMHEDGLADAADGLWGAWDRDRRLDIMKDSRIGTYGVLALILSLVLRWSAITALISAGHLWGVLIVAGAVSRAPLPAMMGWMPNARNAGLSHSVGRPADQTIWAAFLAAGIIGIVLGGWWIFVLALTCGGTAATCAAIARAKIGGQTGDILGATQQMTEIAAFVTLAALAG